MKSNSIPKNANPKKIKKPKDIRILPNYIPVKNSKIYSNMNVYESETTIQKYLSYKYAKNKKIHNFQAKSVQTTHQRQFSPKNKTLKLFLEHKNNKINKLEEELLLYKNQINLIKKNQKIFSNLQNEIKNKIINLNKNNFNNKEKEKNNSKNKYIVDKNTFLINNKSCVGFSSRYNNENVYIENNIHNKLKKELSNFLTENSSDKNTKILNNYLKNKNNEILRVLFRPKKERIFINNEVESEKMSLKLNKKISKLNKGINFKKNNNNLREKKNGDNNNIYLYKKTKEKILINKIKKNIDEDNLDIKFKNLTEKINNIFNCYFYYYKVKNNK